MNARHEFSEDEVRSAISVALKLDENELEFQDAVQSMVNQAVPIELALRVKNMLPIIAGRIMMREMDLKPQLADYYIIHDVNETQATVRFSECGVCRIIHEVIAQDPVLVLKGWGSCEFLSLNDALNRLGNEASPEDLARIQVLPPEMGGEPLFVNSGTA